QDVSRARSTIRLRRPHHSPHSAVESRRYAGCFLNRHVLEEPLPWLEDLMRAQRPERLAVVLTIRALTLRIKDVDFDKRVSSAAPIPGPYRNGSDTATTTTMIYTSVLRHSARRVRSPRHAVSRITRRGSMDDMRATLREGRLCPLVNSKLG